ncbi:MAG: hypothetical protein ACWGOX_02970 [Desulforhopalus sp.]
MREETASRVEIAQLHKELEGLENNFDHRQIEETAIRLEGCNYAPPIITSVDKFLRFDRQGFVNEIDRILSLPESEACAFDPGSSLSCDNLKVQYISVLFYYYKKLLKLRQGDVEEWDEIDELYIHD